MTTVPVDTTPDKNMLSDTAKSCQLLNQQKIIAHLEENLSLEGLPKGSDPHQVFRCIQLLEHVMSCKSVPDKCEQGEGCGRTKQVLAHYFSCKYLSRGKNCKICPQVLALCRNHSDLCQATKGNCAVPFCRNKRQGDSNPDKILLNLPTMAQNKKEYQYVIKKLAEVINLPTKSHKCRGVKRLLVTNRKVTREVLQHILAKKHRASQPANIIPKMENLAIENRVQPMAIDETISARSNLGLKASNTPLILKVFVEVLSVLT